MGGRRALLPGHQSKGKTMRIPSICAGLLCAALFSGAALADGNNGRRYEVTITNITKGQTFTPLLVATHTNDVQLFQVGAAASPALETLAESGDTMPATDELLAAGRAVGTVETIPGLLGPGQSVSVVVQAPKRARRLSVAAMLIPTNDTFVALNSVPLPRKTRVFDAPAYDAGTEANDQNCTNIPGPRCQGAGSSAPADGDEGFIHIGNGFHELGTGQGPDGEVLGPFTYDWRNPVARVAVRRLP